MFLVRSCSRGNLKGEWIRRACRGYQYGIILLARACARFLKLIRYNTQDILEAFWIFRIALGRIPPEGLIVEAQSASFSVRSTDLMDLKVALVGAHEFEGTD